MISYVSRYYQIGSNISVFRAGPGGEPPPTVSSIVPYAASSLQYKTQSNCRHNLMPIAVITSNTFLVDGQ